MRLWIKIIPLIFIFYFTIQPKNIDARSGCCSHHGGVCGCGCCDGSPLSSTCAPYYPGCGGGGGYDNYQAQPSCPSMSSYNSVSGKCECYSGYLASGSSCVPVDQACKNKYGYNSEQDSSSDLCKCKYGYTWNSSSTKCISLDESCQNEYGYNSKATLSGDKCECKSGYTWNKATTKCITKDSACQELNGSMSRSNSSGNCECLSGYEFNGSQCVKKKIIKPTPTIVKKEIIKTPTMYIPNLSGDTSFTKDIEASLTDIKLGNKEKNISAFFSKLFSWFFD